MTVIISVNIFIRPVTVIFLMVSPTPITSKNYIFKELAFGEINPTEKRNGKN